MSESLVPIGELKFETAAEHHTRNVPVRQDLLSVTIYPFICLLLL